MSSSPSGESLPTVVRLGGNIGAEIRNVDLREPLGDEQFAVIHDALVRHEVIVLRDQDITLDQQMAFGRRFGELSIHPFSPNLDDKREVIVLDHSADNPPALTDQWHADETFRTAPPALTILRAKVVPEYGGDTLFACMTAAYTGLSERMKKYIHGLEAVHDYLYGRAQVPEYQLRVKWASNTVVIWDNRSTHHYAPHDYYPQRRTMNRVTVSGDPVRGVAGDYTPEQNVASLPDGHDVKVAPPGKRPIRVCQRSPRRTQRSIRRPQCIAAPRATPAAVVARLNADSSPAEVLT